MELLDGFSETGKETSEDLMEYLMEEVPDFKEASEKAQEENEITFSDEELYAFNANIAQSSDQEIELASLSDFARYLNSFEKNIKTAKIVEATMKNKHTVFSVMAAGF